MTVSRQTKLKLKKGFVRVPIKYRVLMIGQFTDADKKEIAKGLIKAITPKAAQALLPQPSKPSKWSLFLNVFGTFQFQVLRYKGLEVAVFWKRQTSEVIPAPEDPVPEGVLENEDDVWVRFELSGKSPRQLVGAVQDEIDTLENTIARQELSLTAKDRIIESNDRTIASLKAQLASQSKPKGVSHGKGKGSKGKQA